MNKDSVLLVGIGLGIFCMGVETGVLLYINNFAGGWGDFAAMFLVCGISAWGGFSAAYGLLS